MKSALFIDNGADTLKAGLFNCDLTKDYTLLEIPTWLHKKYIPKVLTE